MLMGVMKAPIEKLRAHDQRSAHGKLVRTVAADPRCRSRRQLDPFIKSDHAALNPRYNQSHGVIDQWPFPKKTFLKPSPI
jgi:hypothetical protein